MQVADEITPYKRLAAAIIVIAVRDVVYRKDARALEFLNCRETREFCYGWGIEVRNDARTIQVK